MFRGLSLPYRYRTTQIFIQIVKENFYSFLNLEVTKTLVSHEAKKLNDDLSIHMTHRKG